jgi:hypothetical protein
MNWFITRVELHGADENDYQRLHEEMQARLFIRAARENNGTLLQLPTAMYFSQSNQLRAADVETLAAQAAAATGCRFWTFTCMTPEWAARNLPPA